MLICFLIITAIIWWSIFWLFRLHDHLNSVIIKIHGFTCQVAHCFLSETFIHVSKTKLVVLFFFFTQLNKSDSKLYLKQNKDLQFDLNKTSDQHDNTSEIRTNQRLRYNHHLPLCPLHQLDPPPSRILPTSHCLHNENESHRRLGLKRLRVTRQEVKASSRFSRSGRRLQVNLHELRHLEAVAGPVT